MTYFTWAVMSKMVLPSVAVETPCGICCACWNAVAACCCPPPFPFLLFLPLRFPLLFCGAASTADRAPRARKMARERMVNILTD